MKEMITESAVVVITAKILEAEVIPVAEGITVAVAEAATVAVMVITGTTTVTLKSGIDKQELSELYEFKIHTWCQRTSGFRVALLR